MAIDESSLSDYVAGEIRAMIGRKRTSGRELAGRLGVSRSWVSYRLTGNTEITLNDLERIADALDVEITALLPVRSHNKTSSPPPVRASGPRSQRALLAPGHATGHHPTRAEVRRPAITHHRPVGSST
jgi:transcriptional regulator with XRE-family HTH domain